MPTILTAQFKVLTPAFLAGADQSRAELRPPSIKGALRFWYRAIDPAYQQHEAALFGGTQHGVGQSRVLIQVEAAAPTIVGWNEESVRQFSERVGLNDQRNGLIYLGYPFQMKARKNEGRAALRSSTTFTLRCVIIRSLDEQQRRALLASLWLLGNLGSLGSRSRRGFGSLTLCDWTASDSSWQDDLKALPILAQYKAAPEYAQGLGLGLRKMLRWFPGQTVAAPQPHIDRQSFRCYLSSHGDRDWPTAMNRAGRLMQDFRLRHAPDYALVKAFLRKPSVPPREVPQRVVFGLPLRFQYRSLKQQEGIEDEALFTPQGGSERHPSLLLIKLAQVGVGFHPLFIRLSGALPGSAPEAQVQTQRKGSRGPELALPALPTDGDLLDQFITHLEHEGK